MLPLRVADCQMPPVLATTAYRDLYGIDEDSARRRLLEATGLAPTPRTSAGFPGVPAGTPFPGRLPAIFNVPPRLRYFTGRQDLLDRLGAGLAAGTPVAVTALQGLGGVGKTQLAVEYAHRHAAAFDFVWWVDAEQATLIGTQLAELGRKLGLPATGQVAGDAATVLDHLRRREGLWLLAFDNATDPADLRAWLPGGTGQVLITSRRSGWGGLTEGLDIDVDVLPRSEAVALLARRLPDIDPAAANALAAELGDLPLALEQAAAYLETTRRPAADYLEKFSTLRGAPRLGDQTRLTTGRGGITGLSVMRHRCNDDGQAGDGTWAIGCRTPWQSMRAGWRPSPMVSRLNPGDDLATIGEIRSDDNSSRLVLQSDGNLVLYRSTGVARWATSTSDGVSAVMQGDGNFVVYTSIGQAVWATGTWGHPGAVVVLQDDGNLVVYDTDGTALWASNTAVVQQVVAGFLPSSSGFHFSNATFPAVPDLTISVFGQTIGIGDASNGLCGGMVYAVRDYFEAGIPIPQDRVNPSSGQLFDYIVKRLFDSFNLLLPLPPPPAPFPGTFVTPLPPFGPGPVTYLHLMNPALPDHETVMSNVGLSFRGRAWVMINDTWPRIRADIDSGHLSPIALVEVKSVDPTTLGSNHQVLVYGYSLDGTDLTFRLYDPNRPDNDTVTMSLSIADPQHTTPVTNSVVSTVWCFFPPVYTFSFPPGTIQEQSDWRWCHKCQGLFFAAGQTAIGTCPAGGQHEKGISGNYSLPHESPFAAGQSDWRWCHKCQGLFFAAGQTAIGTCPAGGQHDKGASGNYTLQHTPAP